MGDKRPAGTLPGVAMLRRESGGGQAGASRRSGPARALPDSALPIRALPDSLPIRALPIRALPTRALPTRGLPGGARSPRAHRPVIALVGIDGSGKTTQARRLAATLRAAGVPATHWRNAGGRRLFGQVAHLIGRRDGQHLLGRRGLLAAESGLRWLAIARALLQSRLTGGAAVMDRYAVCQYASIRAHAAGAVAKGTAAGGAGDAPGSGSTAGDVPGRGERLARMAYRIFRAPDITLLLDVEPGEARRRIEARGTDHESLHYLTRAREAYRSLPEYPTFVVINAGASPDEVARAVSAHVQQLVPHARPAGVPAPRGEGLA